MLGTGAFSDFLEIEGSEIYPKVLTPAMNRRFEELVAPGTHTKNMVIALQALSQMPLERLYFGDILDPSKISYARSLNEFSDNKRIERIPFYMALRDRSQRLGLLNGNIAKIIGKLGPRLIKSTI